MSLNSIYYPNLNFITGTIRSESLFGTNKSDAIYAVEGNDFVYGRGGNDGLFGGLGNDVLNGGGGNDELFGDWGNDKLIGGSGKDEFHFQTGTDTDHGVAVDFGHDIVKDFKANVDTIVFDGSDEIKSFADVKSHSQQVGQNLVISFDGGDVTLNHVKLSQLDRNDFDF